MPRPNNPIPPEIQKKAAQVCALRRRIHAKQAELNELAAELGEVLLELDRIPDRPSNRWLARELLGFTEARYRGIIKTAERRRSRP